MKKDMVCLPQKAFLQGRRLVEVIIDHAHIMIGHFGQLGTSCYICHYYWWPTMATDIELFCSSCPSCQVTKDSTKRPAGLLHTLPIPDQPWQSVGMDFMCPLPKSNGHDYLLVVIDCFTPQVHLIPTNTRVTAKEVAWLFVKEIIRLHGMPESIVSDRDAKFTSSFWKELHWLMGTKLLMSTSFHPQGVTKWGNRSIGQVLQAMVRNNQKDCAELCLMVEFALNSSVSATTGYAPFKLNCGYIPPLGQCISTDTKYAGVKQFAQQVLYNLMAVHDTIIESRMVQMHHVNSQQCQGEEYPPGSMVYLLTKNLALPKGWARKLLPRYIGPYKVVETHTATLTVTLKLPPELVSRQMHLMFHMSLIQAHMANDNE